MKNEASTESKLSVLPGNEVVISGIAGRFPESDNMNELHNNLMEKRDMVTEDNRRWKPDVHARIPKRAGKMNNLHKFDAVFFGIHSKQVNAMNPMSRMLLEHAYEAIVDAGVNPKQLRGTKTGVFVSACFSESSEANSSGEQVSEFSIPGSSRALFANRISYCFDLIGPSLALDTGCSSSLSAFELAYRSINDGSCDAAIVGGSNLCLDPYTTLKYVHLGALSPDGRCKTWDQSADGYVRSEAVCVSFLQKAKDAKRIYATVVHTRVNIDGYKDEGIHFPSRYTQAALFSEVYKECGVSPSNVSYVEAHGTGTKVGDPEETAAIDAVMGRNRTTTAPLLIGSVKTNLGHSETASGLVAIAKIILAMESGIIPPNLHYKQCKQDLQSIVEGRLKVVTDLTPWKGEYAAVNNFGIGGTNAHLLLRINCKEKINNGAPDDGLPRLVVVSGRTENAVTEMLRDLESKPVDVEQLALLYKVHSDEINGHLYKGYTILPPRGISKFPVNELHSISGAKRPVWFVFSSMGSQWPAMGKTLLRITAFASAIEKCDSVLRPFGVDIFRVIADDDESIFDNILNCFIGIAAIQIGLVDILRSLRIEPDFIIGHSFGELGCAYADGCLTAEQVILSAYYRGLVSVNTKFIAGSMAAVGLGNKEIRKLCPHDIVVACHNSPSSSTISGPAESMKNFLAELKLKNIFAKEVPCGNIAYHSSYIAAAGPKLLANLKKVIPNPKLRSHKWMSTSVEMDKWSTELARSCSAHYHTNNFLSPVLFEETSSLIPEDAITIEIAPHGFFQSILKQLLPATVTNISLMQRGNKDNFEILLKATGKMFNAGLYPQIEEFYPKVTFPVSRGTPMISPMIKWEHKDDWFVAYFEDEQNQRSGGRVVRLSMNDPDYEIIAGHVIDGRILVPAACYLKLIWETFATMKGKDYNELPVVYENIKFLRTTLFSGKKDVELTLTIHKGTGRFEVAEGDASVVTGSIRIASQSEAQNKWIQNFKKSNEEEYVTSADVYKECNIRGYQYTGKFRCISRATENGLKAHIVWHDWITFIDGMLQTIVLGIDTRELFIPTAIEKIVINPKLHYAQMKSGESEQEFEVFNNKLYNIIFSRGVQICGLEIRMVARKKFTNQPFLEEYKFVPFMDETEMNLHEIASLATNVVVENHVGVKVKTVELLDRIGKKSFSINELLSPRIAESFENMPFIKAEVTMLRLDDTINVDNIPESISILDIEQITKVPTALLVVGHQLLAEDRTTGINLALQQLKHGGFILTRENETFNIEDLASINGYHIIFKKKCGKEIFCLLRKKQEKKLKHIIIEVHNNKFDWVQSMKKSMSEVLGKDKTDADNTRILFVAQDGFDNGLLGFIKCLRREPGGESVRGILIQDPTAPIFSLDNPMYTKHVEKDLTMCVVRENGVWGGYTHLILPSIEANSSVYHSLLNQNDRGNLSSLTWIEGPIRSTCNAENLVKVIYASLNFKDVMFATGKLFPQSDDPRTRHDQKVKLGAEYSGYNSLGNRVMGFILNGALASGCIADPALMWPIPDRWSLEDAATVTSVYATCCSAFYSKGNMRKGDKVLIHAGAGGVGQAAINLALAEGCEVFTTVGSVEKREFIKANFPQIKDDHIGNSRDTSFEHMIKEQTNGYGVDIVLNCLSEEKLLASVNCLAYGGRFIEIGRIDLEANNPLGMKCFLREISFHVVMLDKIIFAPEQKKLELKLLLDKYIKNGAIKPIVRKIFPRDDIEAAFRYMGSGKSIGKILIAMQEENTSKHTSLTVIPQYYCLENRSYVIHGGLGGFGLELCDWLVMRGAKNLVITSRTGVRHGYQRLRMASWKKFGVTVIIVSGKDPSEYEDCKFIIDKAAELAPIDGIFNLAVVLKDALWENQSAEAFTESFRPKAWATKNFDLISRKLCTELRHFVVFSSGSCGRGNPGQSNYGMANSAMERICEQRVADGLPGLAIQWGAIGEVGIVANMQEDNKEIVIGGTLPQGIFSCLDKLNEFMVQNRPIVSSTIFAKKEASKGPLTILDTVLEIMCLKDLKGINVYSPLSDLGVDSIISLEIKRAFEQDFDLFLDVKDIRNLTFSKLQELANPGNSNEKSKRET